MLSDEPIDEDLEALLYAQVYYGKEQEIDLPNLIEPEPINQVETTSEITNSSTGSYRHTYKKPRYFESNLAQKDKEKENRDILKESSTEPATKENINSEKSVVYSTVESNIVPELLEKTIQNPLPIQKDQELQSESTPTPQHQFIKISTSSPNTNTSLTDSTQIVTSALLSTPSESNHPQLLNNITINQYLFPSEFEQRLRSSLENVPLSNSCKNDLRKLKNGNLSEQEFFNNLKRRLKIQKKQQNKIRKAYLKKQQSIAQSEIICLSDSDSSDIEVVGVTSIPKDSNKKPSNMKGKVEVCLEDSANEAVDDDEIIYIAPPPVPVINIDTEESDLEDSDKDKDVSENSSINQQEAKKDINVQNLPDIHLDNDDETPDDFLQPKNTPNNFNFSLHGSDFQEPDFVRPANPTDVYETESSTSTSDFNRDSSRQFCNTVKTIVFNEVEFPNQDIFDENNLESFGEFITPRRADKEKISEITSEPVDTPSNSKANKRANPKTSSESSSESEYEGSNIHLNLPVLSPMLCADFSPKKSKTVRRNVIEQPKKKKGKLDEEVENNTKCSKKKSKDKSLGKDDGIINAEGQEIAEQPARKQKRKNCAAIIENDGLCRKKNKRKKNKSSSRSADELEEVSEASSGVSDRNLLFAPPKKSLKDKREDTSFTFKSAYEDEIDANSALDESFKKKTKKKKKHLFLRHKDNLETNKSVNFVDQQQEVLTIEDKDVAEDSGKKKEKKKKAKELSCSKGSEDGNNIENQREPIEENNQVLAKQHDTTLEDNGKKKNKKRKQKGSSESNVVFEASSTTNDENGSLKTTPPEEESINKSSGEQEVLTGESSILEENNSLESSSTRKKNKRKKRTSSDKRSSVEERNVSNVENENSKVSDKSKDESFERQEITEAGDGGKSGEKIVEKLQNQEEEDIILIEQVIPVHTIESSESDEDIVTFDDVGVDLELANISDKVPDEKNYDVEYVRSKMSDDPEKWKILASDRYNLNIAKKGPRCKRCRNLGHISVHCPIKSPLPVCTLCGESGHQEPRCPNKVCFTCGQPGNYSTVYCYMCVKQRKSRCNLCSIVGHRAEYCPDLWRRYFLTTTEGPLKVPKKNCPTLKPRNKQWCSGCASNGHLEFECNTYKWMREYPASSPQIFKYQDVYGNKAKAKEKAPRTPRSPSHDRDYHNFLAKTFSKPRIDQRTYRQKAVARCLSILDKNLEEDEPAIEENRQVIEQPAESLQSANESQVEPQQIVKNQPTTGQTVVESQVNNPGTDFGFSETNLNQPAQPAAFSPTDQPRYSTDQVQSTPRIYSGRRRPAKSKRRSPRLSKINPVSVLRPTGYTPYHSVLNPYSLMGAPFANPSQGLFNQVPNNILANQLVNLASAVANFQNPGNQDSYNYRNQEQSNFYHIPQLGAQIPSLLSLPLTTYQNFSEPVIPEPYCDIQGHPNPYANREFLDRPHTITRDPMEDYQPPENQMEEPVFFREDREGQMSLHHQLEDNFQRKENYERDRYGGDLRKWLNRSAEPGPGFVPIDTPIEPSQEYDYIPGNELPLRSTDNQYQIANDGFVPLNTIGQENVRVFNKSSKRINVDEPTMKKLNSGSVQQLKELIIKELAKLDSLQRADPKVYKRKLNTIDHLKKIEVKTNATKKQMYFLYKQINMFLFGVHRMFDGNRHLDLLRKFVYQSTGGDNKRKGLLLAYAYIFGGEHPQFNYRRSLNTLSIRNKK